MEINTGEIILRVYDDANLEHVNVINEFKNGSNSKFIHRIPERLMVKVNEKSYPFNTAFIVNCDNQDIGYVFISALVNDEVFLEISILKKFRSMGYGGLCLDEVTDYLFDNYNIKGISLDIDPSNEASIRTALSCGYSPDSEEFMERSMNGNMLYRKDNYYYVNRRKK